MSTISSVGSAATQPPIKKRKVLDTNQIPALTSTYITWKDHTTKQNQLSDANHQVQQVPQSSSIPMTLYELLDDCKRVIGNKLAITDVINFRQISHYNLKVFDLRKVKQLGKSFKNAKLSLIHI